MATVDAEQLLASIAATSGESLVFISLDGTIRWASAATESVMGWRPQELVGRHVSVLGLDALLGDQGDHREWLRATGTERRVGAGTTRDGRPVETAVRLGEVRDNTTGETVGVVVIVQDVTDEVRTKRALELSRARFEQVRTPRALVDLRGHLTSVNPAWCDLFGHSEESLIHRDLVSLVHPSDLVNVAEQLAPLRRGDIESASYEAVFQDARGQNLTLLVDVTLLRQPDGSPYALAAFARDLTEVQEARHRLATQESLYLALGRQPWDAAIVTDADLNIVYVSPPVIQMLGYEQAEMLLFDDWEFVHPDDEERMRQAVANVSAEPHLTEHLLIRVKHKLGEWRWVEESWTNCLTDPSIGGIVVNLRDITEQVETEQALRLSEARHRAIVETAQEGIWAIAADGDTLFANDKMAQILGLSVDDVYGLDALDLLRPDLPRGGSSVPSVDEAERTHVEVAYLHPSGGERILSVSSSRWDAQDSSAHPGMLFMVADVTQARRAESKLRHQATHDPLTGLPNRHLLLDRLKMAAARQQRSEASSTAVLFLDLDQFKAVNDSRGHVAGDELLTQIANRLSSVMRAADTVGRLGGDEFAVICEDTSAEAAMVVAARIHETLSEPVILAHAQVRIRTSIGVAVSPPADFSDLLRLADAAMYEAKKTGGGTTVLHGSR